MYSRDYDIPHIRFFNTAEDFAKVITYIETRHELGVRELLTRDPALTTRRTATGKSIPLVAVENNCSAELFRFIIEKSKEILLSEHNRSLEMDLIQKQLEKKGQFEHLDILVNEIPAMRNILA